MKKIILANLLIGGLSLFFTACRKPVITQTEQAVPKTITVSGTGSVILKASQLSMKFYVRTSEWSIHSTVEKNTTATTKVIEAIKALGIDEQDITTVDYKISQDNSGTKPGIYTCINNVLVLVRNPELAGEIISVAIANGASGLTDFFYTVPDKTSSIRQARTLAIQNAQDAATLLAGASACKVDSVLDIKEELQTFSKNSLFQDFSLGSTAITSPMDEGSITLNSTVTITYSLVE